MSPPTIRRRLAWQGPSWSLMEAELTYPDGTVLRRGLIEHPGSVILVPLLGDEVVLLRQYRLALDQTIVELPAGTRQPGEAWEACAQRELREETGYRAGQLEALGTIWLAPGLSDERMALFLATELRPDPLPGDRDETISLTKLPLAELARQALAGELEDAKSGLAVLRALAQLERLSVA